MTTPLRILQVGGYPPPYGGITVHIQRLCREASRAGLIVRVADPLPEASDEKRALWNDLIVPLRGPAWLKFARLVSACRESGLVHFHASALENLWMLGPVAPALGRPYVVSIHSGNFPGRWAEMTGLKRALIARLLSRSHALVCVSEALRDFVASILPRPQRVLVLPAFIPPERPAKTHPEVEELRKRHEKIVIASGFPLDNYGLTSFVDAMKEVSRERAIGTVVVLYPTTDPRNPDRYRTEETRVRTAINEFARASRSVLVLEGLSPEVFASVQMGCDLFVRNTVADGDSVALREAGHLGCQIVASGCTSRPVGSILFASQDPRALARAIQCAIDDPALGRITSAGDNARPIIELYRDVLGLAS